MDISYESLSGISQIFYVPDETGIFLTSIEVFFQNKDDSAPITLQLRNVVAGNPGNIVIPFSEVTLNPDQVFISADSSIPTRFTFPSPVYLSGPQQQSISGASPVSSQFESYSITLTSNSANYKVFLAELGNVSNEDGTTFSNKSSLGSLFKSQNAYNWIPSNLEYLKYNIYRASFTQEGLLRLFNTKSSIQSRNISVTGLNQFVPLSKRIVVGLGSTNLDSNVSIGVSISQGSASAILTSIGSSVISTLVSNVGTGYTDGTFANIELTSDDGFGQGAKATIGVVNSGITTVNITDGGSGYSVGDILSIDSIGNDIGFGGKLEVQNIGDPNSLELSDVQGQFNVGLSTVYYVNSSGISSEIGIGLSITSISQDPYYDGLHMKVDHINHGMHSQENYVNISQFRPISSQTNSKLVSNISSTDTTIELESTSGFETFEGLPVDGTNIGYALIGNEVISYDGVSGNFLSNVTRSLDNSFSQPFNSGTYVYKYEFNGISLRRINKIHNFADVDITNHPIGLDSYFIKIDTSSDGKDRSNNLYFKETIQSGESGTSISQNIQFEMFKTQIRNIILSKTDISSKVRTFTGTSVDGNENSFEDGGFTDFSLNNYYYFNSPRLVSSSTNEERFNLPSPGNRSLQFDLLFNTQDNRVSPVIDTLDMGVILKTNRVNSPVTDFANDDRVRTLYSDPNETVYISKIIDLNIPANSIKVILTAAQSDTSDIRVFYRIFRPDVKSINYEPFPGYTNYQIGTDGIKRVINPSLNDGSADYEVIKDSSNQILDYEYSVDDLPDFTGFSIKIVMSGTNQANPPYLTLLRAIATKKPSL